MEGHAVADLHGPLGQVLVGLHRLGEERDVVTVLVGDRKRVIDGAGDLDAGDGQLGLGQAPAAGALGLQRIDELTSVLGWASVGAVAAGPARVAVAG